MYAELCLNSWSSVLHCTYLSFQKWFCRVAPCSGPRSAFHSFVVPHSLSLLIFPFSLFPSPPVSFPPSLFLISSRCVSYIPVVRGEGEGSRNGRGKQGQREKRERERERWRSTWIKRERMKKRPVCNIDTDEILLCCVCVCVCVFICVCVGSFSDTPPTTSPPPLQWNVADDDGDVISRSLKFSNQGGLIDEFGPTASWIKAIHSWGDSEAFCIKSIITGTQNVKHCSGADSIQRCIVNIFFSTLKSMWNQNGPFDFPNACSNAIVHYCKLIPKNLKG